MEIYPNCATQIGEHPDERRLFQRALERHLYNMGAKMLNLHGRGYTLFDVEEVDESRQNSPSLGITEDYDPVLGKTLRTYLVSTLISSGRADAEDEFVTSVIQTPLFCELKDKPIKSTKETFDEDWDI